MFLLHERTRKSLCRLGFIALCALPTGAVGLWAAVRNSDVHRTACEAELTNLFRLDASLDKIEYPEPGVARYHNLQLGDPGTEGPIARIEKVEARTTSALLSIVAPRVQVELKGAGALAELLHGRLRDRIATGDLPIRIAIGELTILSRKGDVSLLDIRGRLEPTSDGRGAQFIFRTAAMAKEASPAVLTIVRSRNAQSGFELDTRGAFQEPAGAYGPALQLLRALVTDAQDFVPVTPEAKALLRMPASL
jgi:hypothetical protein